MLDNAPRYRKFSDYLKRRFGRRVYRVGLCGGFTCPNRDGTLGRGGCTFCNPESSRPLGYLPGMPVADQLAAGITYVRKRHRAERFIAYFSDYTTTHADVETLRRLYGEGLEHPDVVGLAVSTRPDCLGPGILALLEELSTTHWVWVELGVQSAIDETLRRIRRGHTVRQSREAVRALKAHGIPVTAHVILGLPGEGPAEASATAGFVDETGVDAVKVHSFHVVEGAALAEEYRRGRIGVLSKEEYVELAVRFIEQIPSRVILQRLTGEAPRRLTIAPDWSVNKLAVVNAIERRLSDTDTWQGRARGEPRQALTTDWPQL